MKRFFGFIAALTVVAVLSGCEKKEEIVPMEDDSFNKIKSAKELVVGLGGNFPPMGFTDSDSNVVGFDIDLAAEVCARLGLKLKTRRISWVSMGEELNSRNVDCIWHGMSINRTRASSMSLSDPYLVNRMVFVVKEKSLESLDSLKDKKLGVQEGSTASLLLESSEVGKSAKAISSYKEIGAVIAALESDSVDAVFMDEVVAKYWNVANHTDYTILKEGLFDEFYAVGFRKKDMALRDSVNAALASMKRDGKFVELTTKWFGK